MTRGALIAVALAGCAGDSFSGDPFPIHVDRANGAFVVSVQAADEDAPRTAVLDVLSPLTVLDPGPGVTPDRRGVELALLGHRTAGHAPFATDDLVTRARFSTTALYLHPCADDQSCAIGAPGSPTPIAGVIGADTLRGDAIRFHPADARIAVLADIAGEGEARDRACDAVFNAPFYGGGTLVVGDTEVGFSGLRIAVGVCLSPDPTQIDPAARGVDAAMVLSTGTGPSIIGTARYRAWQALRGGPALSALPPAEVLLPSGPVSGRLARIDSLALGSASAPRGACRDVYAHHLLSVRDCAVTDDCPCTTAGDTFCGVQAVLELASSFEVLVVSDQDPLLQALRAELRPAQPEIDGILGVSAFESTELDVDYPHGRLLFRCAGAGCTARPQLRDRDSRPTIDRCVLGAIPAQDGGVDDGDATLPASR